MKNTASIRKHTRSLYHLESGVSAILRLRPRHAGSYSPYPESQSSRTSESMLMLLQALEISKCSSHHSAVSRNGLSAAMVTSHRLARTTVGQVRSRPRSSLRDLGEENKGLVVPIVWGTKATTPRIVAPCTLLTRSKSKIQEVAVSIVAAVSCICIAGVGHST